MTIKFRIVAIMLSAVTGVTQAASPCEGIIKSSRDAVEKSDWIVEAEIDHILGFSSEGKQLTLMLSGMKLIKGVWPNPKIVSGTVLLGPCMPGGKAAFEGTAVKRILGQRMRIYGSRHLDSPQLRAFYVEPVAIKLAVARPMAILAETKVHRQAASNPIAGGWHRAHSTEGEYSIDMPAPFLEVAAVTAGKAGVIGGHMLRATDANGYTFIAVREPNGHDQSMAGSFDTEIQDKNSKIVQFKGVSAVATRTIQGAAVMHSLMFRVPGGTYMLGVSVPRDREKESLAMRERFYQSLAFD